MRRRPTERAEPFNPGAGFTVLDGEEVTYYVVCELCGAAVISLFKDAHRLRCPPDEVAA